MLPSDGLNFGDTISPDQVEDYFRQDVGGALAAARTQALQAGVRDPEFIAPLASVNFQLGPNWTNVHKKTWELIQKGDYAGAAEEAAKSKWYKQTPKRVTAFQGALRRLPPKPTAE